MTEKKPYSQPQLFRVELNQEQAILSACSLTTTSVSNNGNSGCRPRNNGDCKNHSGGGRSDSGPRSS